MSEFKNNLTKLQEDIDYQFEDEILLESALTHPSFSKESKIDNYQRLEFLGDTVLGLIIAEIVVRKYPLENEGQLSKRKAHLVSGKVLSKIAKEIALGNFMRFSNGEKISGGKENKRILENALEALIGAIYLDANLEACKKFVLKNWQDAINNSQILPKDPVSLLQEIVQSKSKKLPQYRIKKIGGNEHQPVFEAIVKFADKEYKTTGSSKKEAQRNVADLAVSGLKG